MFVIENVKSPVKINQLPYCDAAFDWYTGKTAPSVENS